MIIAHRGYKKNHPENTIAAFDAAFSAGADAIETDLRRSITGKIIVSHNPVINGNKHLGLDELFEYIASKNKLFFLELKSSDPELLACIIKKIHNQNAWDKVHLIGFASRIRTALLVQDKFSRLLVDQIIMLPWLDLTRLRVIKKSNAVFFGWLDGIKYSENFFRRITSVEQIAKFKQMYESNGFKVMAGVLNREDGIKYFQKAGIYDIFTDEIELANKVLTQSFACTFSK